MFTLRGRATSCTYQRLKSLFISPVDEDINDTLLVHKINIDNQIRMHMDILTALWCSCRQKSTCYISLSKEPPQGLYPAESRHTRSSKTRQQPTLKIKSFKKETTSQAMITPIYIQYVDQNHTQFTNLFEKWIFSYASSQHLNIERVTQWKCRYFFNLKIHRGQPESDESHLFCKTHTADYTGSSLKDCSQTHKQLAVCSDEK